MMEVQYFCRLRPLGEYFLGGEKTFDFGNSKGNVKNNYFIHSEEEISQATILGMMRFVMLKKNQLLSNGWEDRSKKEAQDTLIGKKGFTIEKDVIDVGYGKLKSISPVLIYKGNEPLLHVPLNHKGSCKTYTPFKMQEVGVSDMGDKTYLPIDFVAKDGLSYDYMKINDGEVVGKCDIFKAQARTRVAKNLQEDGFFKRTYRFLGDNYSFGFYVSFEEDWCSEKEIKDEIVYIGQEKSAFVLSFEKKAKTELKIERYDSNDSDYDIYYVVSDSFIEDYDKIKNMLLYAIVDKKSYRFLTRQNGKNYAGSRKMSERFQFVRAGSVFYVRKEKVKEFEAEFSKSTLCKSLIQIGFNNVIRMGE